MTPKLCRYGCGMMLEAWDDNAKKYIEAGTDGGLHTRERCEEAKAKLEQKNNHGNEQVQDTSAVKEYVDHTLGAKGQSKVKTFWSQNSAGVETDYNAFLNLNNGKIKVQGGQFQFNNGTFAITVYYEEIKQ